MRSERLTRVSAARRTAIGAIAALLIAPASARAQVLDRILAVVGGEIILLSDANAAMRFGLVDVPAGSEDPVRAALNALIDRQLQLFEVNRFLPPEPAAAAIDERLRTVRQRFPTEAAYQAALAEVGLTEAQVRSRIRDNLRIESYRTQRFAAALQPTDEDLLRYYRSHEPDFMKDGARQPFEQVREQVRERVVRERSSTLINDWLDTLRRRADVQILLTPKTANSPQVGS